MKLSELLDRSGLDVLDHLERELAIPVVDGLQAQGDLIVIPCAMLRTVQLRPHVHWQDVPPHGIELVRGVDGRNPHTLVADPGTCRWTPWGWDPLRLTIGVFENSATAYLIHPEHGGSGVAPGHWIVRRQQERGDQGTYLVAD